LTDERSVTHGYGPICADRYSLPWDAPRNGTRRSGPQLTAPRSPRATAAMATAQAQEEAALMAEAERVAALAENLNERSFDAAIAAADRADQQRADDHNVEQMNAVLDDEDRRFA
jgi:hypothetical protein